MTTTFFLFFHSMHTFLDYSDSIYPLRVYCKFFFHKFFSVKKSRYTSFIKCTKKDHLHFFANDLFNVNISYIILFAFSSHLPRKVCFPLHEISPQTQQIQCHILSPGHSDKKVLDPDSVSASRLFSFLPESFSLLNSGIT